MKPTKEMIELTDEVIKLARQNGLDDEMIYNNFDKCIKAYIEVQDVIRERNRKKITSELTAKQNPG